MSAEELGAYDGLASAYGSIFDTVRWTSAFQSRVLRVGLFDAGNNLRGGFCLADEKRLGLRILRCLPLTPQIGPFFGFRATNPAARTAEQRDVVEATAEYINAARAAVVSLELAPGITDCLPFYWRGFKVVPQYTYRLDLTQKREHLLSAMSRTRRNDLTKAERDGLEATETTDTAELRRLVDKSFRRQNRFTPLAATDKVLQWFPPGQNSFAYVTLRGGRSIAAVYVVHDRTTAYHLLSGYSDQESHRGAGALATYHAILKSQELGLKVYDFEGSVIPTIEEYFRGFGGQLTPIFTVHKAWLPLEMGLKLVKRNRF